LREITPTEDGDFTYEKFEKKYNSDLVKGLGNLVARVITLIEKSKIKNKKLKIKNGIKKSINQLGKNITRP
jgi:methionyl-tRNA synthetase